MALVLGTHGNHLDRDSLVAWISLDRWGASMTKKEIVLSSIRFSVESTRGITPTNGCTIPARTLSEQQTIKVEHHFSVTLICDCLGMIRHSAMIEDPLVAKQWTGVPCDRCDRTYTIQFDPTGSR